LAYSKDIHQLRSVAPWNCERQTYAAPDLSGFASYEEVNPSMLVQQDHKKRIFGFHQFCIASSWDINSFALSRCGSLFDEVFYVIIIDIIFPLGQLRPNFALRV